MTMAILAVSLPSFLAVVFWVENWTINTTPSMAIGIWKINPVNKFKTLTRGSAVLFCPPDNDLFRRAKADGILHEGSCTGSYTPLLKEVVGLPGDVVEYIDGGYSVNGRKVENSGVQPLDLGVKPVFYRHLVVPDGYLWLMGSYSALSFDSRYFGPVERSRIYANSNAMLVSTSR